MLGLDIVAAVTGIVSAFSGATTLFRTWRKERQKKHREKESKAKLDSLAVSLFRNGPAIQEEYDAISARLGRVFALGDGEYRF